MNSLYPRPLGSVRTLTLTFLCSLAQRPDTHFPGDTPSTRQLPLPSDSRRNGISRRNPQRLPAVGLLRGGSSGGPGTASLCLALPGRRAARPSGKRSKAEGGSWCLVGEPLLPPDSASRRGPGPVVSRNNGIL